MISWMTVDKFAILTGKSNAQVHAMIRNGTLEAVKVGRAYRISMDAYRDYLAPQTNQSSSTPSSTSFPPSSSQTPNSEN